MCTSWHTDSDLALCPNVLYHQEIEKVICDSGGNYSAPLRMSSFLTVLRQQVLHWTWSFHSSWLFLRWSVARQNHLHRRPFGSNHWLSVLSLSSLPLVRWHYPEVWIMPVIIGYMRICEKSEQIVFYFEDAFLETLKFPIEVCQNHSDRFTVINPSNFVGSLQMPESQ